MPQTCSAAECKSRKDKDCKKSFYRIPVDKSQRERWISAINRKDWTPTPYSRICSDHFILGHPSKDPKHPDYAPSVFPGSKQNCRSRAASCNESSPALSPINTPTSDLRDKRQLSDVDAAETLLHMSKRPRVESEDKESNICRDCQLTSSPSSPILLVQSADKVDSKLSGEEGEGVRSGSEEEIEDASVQEARVALLQAEIHQLKEENNQLLAQRLKLEREKKSLESEKAALGNQRKQLEAGVWVLWKSLQDSERHVKELKNKIFLINVGVEAVKSRL